MTQKTKNIAVILTAALWIFGLSLWGIFAPDAETSLSERRRLAQAPKLTAENLVSGKFMSDFEKYSADQFPLRDGFRRIKAYAEYYGFWQLDSNGIYFKDGYASKLEYPLNEAALTNVSNKINYIYDEYIKDGGGKVFLSVIPDKNCFLAPDAGYPCLDSEKMVNTLRESVPFAEYIDIFPTLDISDYYTTDTHWRQEKIIGTARTLAEAMGAEIGGEYTEKALDAPFYGVYSGQSALPLKGESLIYLESPAINGMTAYNFETDAYGGVYDFDAASGTDPYEIFLSGPRSLMTVENPAAKDKGELIIFRDSFGSSVAPLLAEGYSKVTLVDIRYLASARLGQFVDFDGADVLFLYSTLVLNNGEVMQ